MRSGEIDRLGHADHLPDGRDRGPAELMVQSGAGASNFFGNFGATRVIT
jgi:hypothetical protein